MSDSRFVFGDGFVRVGDNFVADDIGIDELRLVLPSEVSLRKLCADSGRYKFVVDSFRDEFGLDRPAKLPVDLLRLLFDGGPEGLR